MTFVATVFLLGFVSLFMWLTFKGLRSRVTGGIGWTVDRAQQPILYWLCIAAYVLILSVGLLFLLIVATFAHPG
jgi:hypothetical protein